MKKFITLLTTVMLLLAGSIVVSATTTEKSIPVNAHIEGIFEVVLPVDVGVTNKDVSIPYFVNTDLPHNKMLSVAIRDRVDLEDGTGEIFTIPVTNSKIRYESFVQNEEQTVTVAAKDLPAGDWTGVLDVDVSVITIQSDGAGLYDSQGILLADWDTLTNTYGLDFSENTVNGESTQYKFAEVLANFNDPYKLVISGEVDRLGDKVLYDSTIKSLVLLEGVTTLGHGSLAESDLEELILPSTLKTIGHNSFQRLALDGWVLPKTVMNIEDRVFIGAQLTNFSVENGSAYFKAENGLLYSIDGKRVLAVVDSSLGSYSVADGAKYLDNSVFANASVTAVSLPESLEYIGPYQFDGSTITTLNIPKNVRYIGEFMLPMAHSLKTLTVDSGNPYFESENNIIYTEDMKELVTVRPGVTGTLNVKEGVEKIRKGSIVTTGYSKIYLPSTLKEIDDYAISYNSITTINIPASVSILGKSVFDGCNRLTSITVDDNNKFYTDYNGDVYNKSMTTFVLAAPKLASHIVPEGVTKIGECAFYGAACTSVVLPSTIEEIDNFGFSYCSRLKSINLPDSVKRLGEYAFGLCTSLKTLKVPSTVEKIERYAFLKIPKVYYKGSLTDVDNWGATQLITNY